MFKEKLRSMLKIQEKRLQNGLKNSLKIFTKVYNFKGFSLIELMISLIVISLITAAFVPVISKKLTTGSIFAGGSGGGFNKSCSEIDEDCDLCAGEICLSCKKTCPAGETLNTTSCSCETKVPYSMAVNGLYVTRFNMGESSKTKIPTEAGVTVVAVGKTCGSSSDYNSKCCWQGSTSGSSCDATNGNYSGCSRTVCNFAAANAICANYKQDGKTWRLPTTSEMVNWANNSKGKGNNGLMLCDGYSGYSSAYCGDSNSCPGTRSGYCYPDSVWSGSIKSSTSAHIYSLDSGSWDSLILGDRTGAFSVRCVSDIVSNCETFASDGETCTTCESGYYLSGKECKKTTEVENCETYSKTENKCETCKDGYNLNGNKCEVDTYDKLVYGVYVTKYNMGDNARTQIPSAAGVTVASVGSSCNTSDAKCCWSGSTSGSGCDDSNGSYSGCNRTVCTWKAANAICANYKQDGRTWRLPTSSDMDNWANYSRTLRNNGLMLCDVSSGYSSAYCNGSTRCIGADTNSCSANYVWGENQFAGATVGAVVGGLGSIGGAIIGGVIGSGSGAGTGAVVGGVAGWFLNSYYGYSYQSGSWSMASNVSEANAYSVRCVSDTVANCATYSEANACTKCKTNYYLKNGKCNPVTKVENCTTYSPTEDKCATCYDAYNLSNNKCVFACTGQYFMKIGSLCVTKYNMGDNADTAIPTSAGVTVVATGKTCGSKNDYSTKCCWKGGTSGTKCDSINGSYSGCNRTVCNWAAATAICANYTKDGKSWRLPTSSELLNWSTYSKTKGNNGLMLCDNYSDYLSAYCDTSNSCPGTNFGDCHPYYVWSGTIQNSTRAYSYYLRKGSWDSPDYIFRTHAFSVRCVAEM